MKKTKIICTIGPSSNNEEIIQQMIESGMDSARINLSHGSRKEHEEIIKKIKNISKKQEYPISILLDTRGPELRIKIRQKELLLKPNEELRINFNSKESKEDEVGVNHPNILKRMNIGDPILFDDGKIELIVEKITTDYLECKILHSGILRNNKRMSIPGKDIDLPPLTEKDIEDINFAMKQDIDFIAASFIKEPEDVIRVRELIKNDHTQLISKIETLPAYNNIKEIIDLSDLIMVARGDLGVELPLQEVVLAQKNIIKLSNNKNKPVITSTQMMESMLENPRPTRAEVSDVYNAIIDGTDAIMSSGETAIGKYPVNVVKWMTKIARIAEKVKPHRPPLTELEGESDIIAHSACEIGDLIGAKGILCHTKSGFTALNVSKYRPDAWIIAATPNSKVTNMLSLTRGIKPILERLFDDPEQMIETTIKECKRRNLLIKGDKVVVTATFPFARDDYKKTNMITVWEVD